MGTVPEAVGRLDEPYQGRGGRHDGIHAQDRGRGLRCHGSDGQDLLHRACIRPHTGMARGMGLMDIHHTQEYQGARSYSVVAPGRCRRTAVREMTVGSVAGVSTGYQNNRFFQWFDERMRTGWDGSFPTQHTGWHIAMDPRFKGLSLVVFLDDALGRVTGAALFAEAASGNAWWCSAGNRAAQSPGHDILGQRSRVLSVPAEGSRKGPGSLPRLMAGCRTGAPGRSTPSRTARRQAASRTVS